MGEIYANYSPHKQSKFRTYKQPRNKKKKKLNNLVFKMGNGFK